MESIYNIVPPKVLMQSKPPMFKSKIGFVAPTSSTFHMPGTSHPVMSNMAGDSMGKIVKDRSHAEFGKPIGMNKNDPTHHLKKFARSSSVPSLREVRMTNPDSLKPVHLKESRFAGGGGPPKAHEIPIMNLVTSKNFIVANAVETILAQPKKFQDNTKDYLKKQDYGKVPNYLHAVKKDIQGEYDYINQLQQQYEQDNAAQVHPMDDEERYMILEGLKSKWEAVNTQYQGETHIMIMDTRGKKYRKEKHEAELAQIEKDIEKLSKKNVHVDLAR
mmetsp:Transcript_54174/g.155660  ORF Transcript_54174/g.155660 Transcript_54174/m.155660 type:complete len:274 (+) Transcript_54174:128-949(+)